MGAKRILAIDDEASFVKLVKLNLEKTGRYQVRVENDSRAAMHAARSFQPDLILLDVMMPGKTGAAIIQEIEADAALCKVPLMFLTASTTRQVAEAQCTTRRSLPIIAKPVDPKELLRHIEIGRAHV